MKRGRIVLFAHKVLGFWALMESAAFVMSFDPRFNGPIRALVDSGTSIVDIRAMNFMEAASLVFAYYALRSAISANSALKDGGHSSESCATSEGNGGAGLRPAGSGHSSESCATSDGATSERSGA